MTDCIHCNGTGENQLITEKDKIGVCITACHYCGGDGEEKLSLDNIKPFTKEPVSHYPRLGELSERLDNLFDEYAGEIPTMAAIGVLESKKFILIYQQLEES